MCIIYFKMKFLLMSSNTSLYSDKYNFIKSNPKLNGISTTPSTPTSHIVPVNLLAKQNDLNKNGKKDEEFSSSVSSIPSTTSESKKDFSNIKFQNLNRSHSEGSPYVDSGRINRIVSLSKQNSSEKPNQIINEYYDSDNDEDLDKSYSSINNEISRSIKKKFTSNEYNDKNFKTTDINSTSKSPNVEILSSEHNGDFVKPSNDVEYDDY